MIDEHFFAKNMGNTERAWRISLGIIIALATLFNLVYLATWAAALLFLTGVALIA